MEKRNKKNGFTIAETLVAIIIMLLASSILITGLPAAKNAYEKVFLKANAEVLLSTGIYSLRNELTFAKNAEIDHAKISYLNNKESIASIININNEKGIVIKRYKNNWEPLVSEKSSDGMILKYSNMTKSSNKIIVSDLGVYKNEKMITKREKIVIPIM